MVPVDNADPTSVIILSEIIVIESIIIIGIVSLFFIKRKKTLSQLKSVLSDFKKNIEPRKSSLKSTYSHCPAMQSPESDKMLDDLVNQEERFVNAMLEAFSKNDTSIIKNIENEIHQLVAPYANILQIDSTEEANAETEETDVPDIDSAIDDLLADEADNAEGDPALDLSEEIESDDEIEEIPEELLSGVDNSDDESDDNDNVGDNKKEQDQNQ